MEAELRHIIAATLNQLAKDPEDLVDDLDGYYTPCLRVAAQLIIADTED